VAREKSPMASVEVTTESWVSPSVRVKRQIHSCASHGERGDARVRPFCKEMRMR